MDYRQKIVMRWCIVLALWSFGGGLWLGYNLWH